MLIPELLALQPWSSNWPGSSLPRPLLHDHRPKNILVVTVGLRPTTKIRRQRYRTMNNDLTTC